MKHRTRRTKGLALAVLATAFTSVFALAACGGGGGDPYDAYAAAYNKVSANGGVSADLDVQLTMDGETSTYTGNFTIDNVNNILYYEMTSDGQTTTQFSDGSYIYTDRGGQKVKYDINGEPPASAPKQDQNNQGSQSSSQPSAPSAPTGPNGETPGAPGTEGGPAGPDAPSAPSAPQPPEFDSSSFMNEFSSFLDAGKIKQLGLLDPIPKAAVTKTTVDGDVYTLEVADSIVENFFNTLAIEEHGNGDTVQIDNLQNFSYKATVSNGVVTGVQYSGDVTVKVPGSLMSDGKDKEYTLGLVIDITFVNPGGKVEINLPDTTGYELVS